MCNVERGYLWALVLFAWAVLIFLVARDAKWGVQTAYIEERVKNLEKAEQQRLTDRWNAIFDRLGKQ